MATTGGWKRSANVPLPTVWARFRGLRPMPNGRVPEFWVQDVPDDMMDAVLEFMCTHVIQNSPCLRAANILEDPISQEETRASWRRHLKMRVSLVALTDGENGKPVIAGCNSLIVIGRDDPPQPKARGRARRIMDEAIATQERRANVMERYGAHHALYASGLLVHSDFRGQGVGLELVKARDPLCRALGVPISYTVFSSRAAQKIAERAGFHSVDEQSFADYRDAEGNAVFAASDEPTFKLMVKEYVPDVPDPKE